MEVFEGSGGSGEISQGKKSVWGIRDTGTFRPGVQFSMVPEDCCSTGMGCNTVTEERWEEPKILTEVLGFLEDRWESSLHEDIYWCQRRAVVLQCCKKKCTCLLG